MNRSKSRKININKNLNFLRKSNHMSIEEVADKIGVSRQAVAKWENGDTIPDIINCATLADLYDVTVDDLLYFNGDCAEVGIGPKGKHIFGTAVLGERGQVVIPKQARELLNLKAGDMLMVLGDTNPESRGIALVQGEEFLKAAKEVMDKFYPRKGGK